MPPKFSLEELSKDIEESPSCVKIMVAPGVEFVVLQRYLFSHVFLVKKWFPFVENMVGICEEMIEVLDTTLTLQQLIDVQVAASAAYLIRTNGDIEFCAREKQKLLLLKAFRYSDTLNPMHVHLMTDALWKSLYANERLETLQNVVRLVDMVETASLTGKVVANCLMWATLSHITGKEYQMHRLRTYDEWMENLNMCHFPNSKNLDEARTLYLVVMVASFLVTAFVCADNSSLEECGYGTSLALNMSHIMALKTWVNGLLMKPVFSKEDIPKDVVNFTKNTLCMVILPALATKELELVADN